MKVYRLFFLVTVLVVSSIVQNHTVACNKTTAKCCLKKTLDKAAKWQIENFTYAKEGNPGYLHDYGADAWTNATFYLGMLEWSNYSDNREEYLNWIMKICDENSWKIPDNFQTYRYGLYHADELCMGQTYLKMYSIYGVQEMMESTKERVDYIINNPPDTSMKYNNKQSWTWCDALFMAAPVYTQLYQLERDKKYLDFMHDQFLKTYSHLYDKKEKLFFRDDSYFDKKEQNGQKIFWGRGNGWVAAALVNILKVLPNDSEYRPFYESLFKELLPRLSSLQQNSGFWHASLLDPIAYPSPETSATSLITYALAYGINEGLLSKEIFYPSLDKAWNALNSAVRTDGKLKWVQPIGADPKNVTEDMTAVYGVGAFLLAGSEIYKMK